MLKKCDVMRNIHPGILFDLKMTVWVGAGVQRWLEERINKIYLLDSIFRKNRVLRIWYITVVIDWSK